MSESEKRLGSQTPTTSFILPYEKTKGQEAIDLYNQTGRTAMPWQELQMYDMMAINDDGLFTHTKYGYSIPRRNGKSELLVARELYALLNGEKVLHTAHRTTTSHASWERLKSALDSLGFINRSETRKEDETPLEKQYISYKAMGLESLEMCMENGGRINFRTRTSKGGLGEGYDILVIDESQEYQDDQESSLKYVVSDSKNPQTIMCGTPPTPISSGTVFTKLRDDVLKGKTKNTGWAEWSVEHMSDPNDVELWYQTNPSMGVILTERKIGDEIGTDDTDFNIQRLGLWIKYNLKSCISQNEWSRLKVDKLPTLKGKLFTGVKFSHDGVNVALSVACRTSKNKIFVETIGCRPVRDGFDWMIDFIEKANIKDIYIDGASGQEVLQKLIKDRKIKVRVILPKVKEIVMSNAMFEQGLFDATLCHNDQLGLRKVVTNTEKRAIGSNGGFGYRSLKDKLEISILDSVVLAFYGCVQFKEKKKQKISY